MEQVLARGHRTRRPHPHRELGPWAPRGQRPGMVSQELERDFARRGKRLLDPEQAAECLLDEIGQGAMPSGPSCGARGLDDDGSRAATESVDV